MTAETILLSSRPLTGNANPAEKLPGQGHIDPRIGLKYVKRTETYQKMLSKFLVQQADLASRIETALQDKDQDAARIMVHSLKGTAGTLGMLELQAIAASCETLLREGAGKQELHTALDSLRQGLTAVCEEIGRMKTKLCR